MRIAGLTSSLVAVVAVFASVIVFGLGITSASAAKLPERVSANSPECQAGSGGTALVVHAARVAGLAGLHRIRGPVQGSSSSPISVTYPGEPRAVSTLVGTAVSVQMQASDPDDPTAGFAYSAAGLPPGLAIDTSTGLISGTANIAGGYYPVTVTATDNADMGESGQVAFPWYVYSTVIFRPVGPLTGAVGDPVQLQLQVSGAVPGHALRYLATGLPPSLSIGCTSGVISGWLWSKGTYHVTISAQDSLGSTGSTSFTWTVALPSDHGAVGRVRLDAGHMCLNDAGNRSANGTAIQIWSCDRRRSQVWTIVQDDTIRIHGKCLSVAGRRVGSNGAKIILSTCTGSPSQRWANENGELGNRASPDGPERCLTAPSDTLRNGTQLEIWECATRGHWEWTLPAGPIVSQVPGKCVDDRGNLSAADTAVQLWSCTGKAAQKWTVGPGLSIRIHDKCLGTKHDRTAAGTPLALEPCGNKTSQEWIVVTSSTSFAGFLWDPFSNTTWCITDPGASKANGTQLILGNCPAGEPEDFWHIP